MTDTTTATISIGRNVGTAPMSGDAWQRFQADVRLALTECGATIYVDAARSVGEWEGVLEDSCTFVASLPVANLAHLDDDLAYLTRVYRQDAIAVTLGETQFVSADSPALSR